MPQLRGDTQDGDCSSVPYWTGHRCGVLLGPSAPYMALGLKVLGSPLCTSMTVSRDQGSFWIILLRAAEAQLEGRRI